MERGSYKPIKQAPPSNGWTHIYNRAPKKTHDGYVMQTPIAPFRIKAATGDHYFLKLLDAYDLSPVMTVFVQSHSVVDLKAPIGTYRVRYACGKSWYGEGHLFGEETEYGEFDTFFRFDTSGTDIQGLSLTIGEGDGGDFAKLSIRPEQF